VNGYENNNLLPIPGGEFSLAGAKLPAWGTRFDSTNPLPEALILAHFLSDKSITHLNHIGYIQSNKKIATRRLCWHSCCSIHLDPDKPERTNYKQLNYK